ncbi:ring-1,2-phenylacetyl-CoA epoxidase subunit PaaC [Haloactinospora alba]|uniref:Ring-1,2-phenylacetyl-CoA epoxidase subunit PaaC n=1 Tax=Haloactinospora alba TaxID=405555 RepID=A0A543N7P7_9ACTN|nr:1,2-phenylacetyl-CoA epoxidase subunit PaaC [Haloactinospora alba]TQN27856.1 ring-1,2-phenylacetyl-CoA epoxidase subunit PaaC [Haloactinospora alba]
MNAEDAPDRVGARAVTADTAAVSYLLRLGDDALVASHRLAELVTRAPQLEEDVALSNISLDLLGQARLLLSYAGRLEEQLTGVLRTEDELAYLRDESQFVNCRLVEFPNTDFAHTVARQLLFSAYAVELYTALGGSTDGELAGIAAKAVKEAAYHRDHAARWTVRLGDGTGESARRMTRALEALWPYTAEVFASDGVARAVSGTGFGTDPAGLRPAWDAFLDGVLAEAGLQRPAVAPVAGLGGLGGRDGVHTEPFGYLLAEMQHLHRSHPGAQW